MKLIVGLGNPGKPYSETRHNVGFMVVDALLHSTGNSFKKARGPYQMSRDPIQGGEVIVAKPETYMNESGTAVRKLLEDFQVPPSQCLVVTDDVNLPLGKVRFRVRGSSGGHHGLESIIGSLGNEGFPRLRVGVGLPNSGTDDLSGYVLDVFSAEEREQLAPQIERAKNACFEWMKGNAVHL